MAAPDFFFFTTRSYVTHAGSFIPWATVPRKHVQPISLIILPPLSLHLLSSRPHLYFFLFLTVADNEEAFRSSRRSLGLQTICKGKLPRRGRGEGGGGGGVERDKMGCPRDKTPEILLFFCLSGSPASVITLSCAAEVNTDSLFHDKSTTFQQDLQCLTRAKGCREKMRPMVHHQRSGAILFNKTSSYDGGR